MKKINIVRALVVMLLMFALSACVPWTRIKEPRMEGPEKAFVLQAPVGWVWSSMQSDRIGITKDGPNTHWIEAYERDLKVAFKTAKLSPRPDALPSELARHYVANLQAELNGLDVEILENAPAVVDGHDAFRVLVQFRNPRGLRVQVLAYGFTSGDRFYALAYRAPALHYFERDLATFERVVESFRLLQSKKA